MRLINADAVIKTLENASGWFMLHDLPEGIISDDISLSDEDYETLWMFTGAFREIIEHEKTVQVADQQPTAADWIPITYDADGKPSCRMPEMACNVLVTARSGYVDRDAYWPGDSCFARYDFKDVTAWMPMPEPYKGDK